MAVKVFLSMAEGGIDPLRPPPSPGDTMAFLEEVSRGPYWPSGRIEFSADTSPDAGQFTALDVAWHSFLRGPLEPLLVAVGLVNNHNLPPWTVRAAWLCLSLAKPKPTGGRPSNLAWCMGFGTACVKCLAKWKVGLADMANPAEDLKRHFFLRADSLADSDPASAREFFNGYFDGRQARAERVKGGDGYSFECLLYMILRRDEFAGLDRPGAIRHLEKLDLLTKDARNFQHLAAIDFPRGRPGPKVKPPKRRRRR